MIPRIPVIIAVVVALPGPSLYFSEAVERVELAFLTGKPSCSSGTNEWASAMTVSFLSVLNHSVIKSLKYFRAFFLRTYSPTCYSFVVHFISMFSFRNSFLGFKLKGGL